ncbi:MAG: ABC transporter ATP-binding protein [Eubacteriales bacterium]|nr:ABC transporter ATP-binding protein [Eubacteriales bacterium]
MNAKRNKKKSPLGKSKTVRRVLAYIRKYIPLIVLSLLLAIGTVAMNLYIPIIVGESIDSMIGEGRVLFSEIRDMLIKIALTAILGAILQWLMALINNKVSYNIVRDIRKDAFDKIHDLPVGYIDSHPHGDILSRVVNDSEQFCDGLLMGFTQLFVGIVTIIGTLIFMIRINLWVALMVVVLTPVSLLVAKFIASRTHSFFVRKAQDTGEVTSYINEGVKNQRVTMAFSQEEAEIAGFGKVNEKLAKSSLLAIFYSSLVNPTTRFLNSIVYAVVGMSGAFFAIAKKITIGGLSCFLSYAGQYAKPFNEISGVISELQNALACAERLLDFIDAPTDMKEQPDAVVAQNVKGEIDFEHVYFSYVPQRPLLTDITMKVMPGQHIAIVGPTGCGKTTLINLLMRFYDVCDGAIKLDGTDIRDITRKSLRGNFGMVLQETWLSNASIYDNISMGKPDATREEVIAAAKQAHAHNFIIRLKDGYDTVIDEGGDSLSAGERQLLCISRIMLSSPPMLILDEATSSIDTRTEMKIQDAFNHLMKGKTTFIVAHRLSTIREADCVLVMKDGNIIERGTHTELLGKGGFYAELYNSQFAGKEDISD